MQWLLEVTVRAKREGIKIYVDRSHQGEVRGGAFVRTSVWDEPTQSGLWTSVRPVGTLGRSEKSYRN